MNTSSSGAVSPLKARRPAGVSEGFDRNVIQAVVDDFYDAARRDPILGPVFEAHVEDWDSHLETMRRFWATVLLGERRYFGNPFVKHSGVPELPADHFRRWLAVFSEILAKHCVESDAMAWESTARRMEFAMFARLGFGQHEDLLS